MDTGPQKESDTGSKEEGEREKDISRLDSRTSCDITAV